MQIRDTPTTCRLQVEQITERTAAVLASIVRDGTPRATQRALAHAMRYWQAWHEIRFGTALPLPVAPVSETAILQFLADHVPHERDDGSMAVELPPWAAAELVRIGVKRGVGVLSHNSVKQRLALLASMHNMVDLPNPLRFGSVQQVLAGAAVAAHNQGGDSHAASPLSPDDLRKAVNDCEDNPAGRRDAALLTVLFESGGRRRGEVRGMLIHGCDRKSEGYVLTIPRIKGKTLKGPMRVPLLDPQAQALDRWLATLAEAGITEGPVFMEVRGIKHVRYGDVGLSGHAVNAVVKRRLHAAGIAGNYSAHSLRKGFATDRLDRGESYGTVQAMTDHADPRTLVQNYYRPKDVLGNPAAKRAAESVD